MSLDFTKEFRNLRAQGWEVGDILDFFNKVTFQRLERERAEATHRRREVNHHEQVAS